MNKLLILSILILIGTKLIGMGSHDIRGLDKAKLLQELFSHASVISNGHHLFSDVLSVDEANAHLELGFIPYIKGRIMKVNLKYDNFNSFEYDKEYGKEAAEIVIRKMREENGFPFGYTR